MLWLTACPGAAAIPSLAQSGWYATQALARQLGVIAGETAAHARVLRRACITRRASKEIALEVSLAEALLWLAACPDSAAIPSLARRVDMRAALARQLGVITDARADRHTLGPATARGPVSVGGAHPTESRRLPHRRDTIPHYAPEYSLYTG